jgi:phage baseplate assembly protein W
MSFLGAPYPIVKHPRGFFRTQSGMDQVKSDLLVLLLTQPGERVMLPEFGTNLKKFFFEPNDASVLEQIKEEIARAISIWEPRIAVTNIEVTNGEDVLDSLSPLDLRQDLQHIVRIRILFTNFNDITKVEELKLEIPFGG